MTYSHYSWYDTVNELAPFHKQALFALSYTPKHLLTRWRQAAHVDRYIPLNRPRQEWVSYGREPNSRVALAKNLTAFLDLASQRGDRVLLSTFVTYVPENYSLEAFRAKRLDYAAHISPLELWGDPEHVMATVSAHNQVVRGLAGKYPEVVFVDQANIFPRGALYFNDPCHFTAAGSSVFVDNALKAIKDFLTAHRQDS